MGPGSDSHLKEVRPHDQTEGTKDNANNASVALGTEDPQESEGGQWASMPRLEDLPSEDVSIGFWLQAVNHTKVEMPVSIKDSACAADRSKALVVDHYVTEEEMLRRWCRYVQAGDPCDDTVSKTECPLAAP